MKIIIVTPDIKIEGGVAQFINNISRFLTVDYDFFFVGQRKSEYSLFNKVKRIILDYFRFFINMMIKKSDLVHLNPSMNKLSFIRDAFFVIIAKLFKKKCIVFWHGWSNEFFEQVKLKPLLGYLYKFSYKKCELQIVLAEEFKIRLQEISKADRVIVLNTAFNESDMETYLPEQESIITDDFKMLYMSRMEAEKGIYEALEVFNILKKKYRSLKLVYAGNGVELDNIRKKIQDEKIQDVSFTGYIRGDEKYKLLASSGIFLLITYYGEGMPVSILEAMACGLPVITRPVGGIKDFFENGKMGYCLDVKNPEAFAEKIDYLLSNQNILKQISSHNKEYAYKNFTSKATAARLAHIYNSII